MCPLTLMLGLSLLFLTNLVDSRDIHIKRLRAPMRPPTNGEFLRPDFEHTCSNVGHLECCSMMRFTFGEVTFSNLKIGDTIEVWSRLTGAKDRGACKGLRYTSFKVTETDGQEITRSGFDFASGARISFARSPEKNGRTNEEKHAARRKSIDTLKAVSEGQRAARRRPESARLPPKSPIKAKGREGPRTP